MAVKKVEIAGVGMVTLVKSPHSRSIRLSVTASGIRVSMPRWTPYAAGTAFVMSHREWIATELAKRPSVVLEAGQRVGKLHNLRFEHVLNERSLAARVTGTEVVVRMTTKERTDDPDVQKRAVTAIQRALKREAELLLPARLKNHAEKHGLSYTEVSVKALKRRWGSCSSTQAITLNLFLMELPWEFIDYVLLHELTHTKHMNHGEDFWQMLTQLDPLARTHSKRLRRHQPVVGTWNSEDPS